MPQTKTVPSAADVGAFLAGVEPEQRRADARALATLMEEVAGEPSRMWGGSIVGCGVRHYRYDSGREGDMPRIGFSPRKAQLVLYVTGTVEEDTALLARLGKHTTGKACLNIKRLDQVDTAVLRDILEAAYRRG
jgi:hypothetical protein